MREEASFEKNLETVKIETEHLSAAIANAEREVEEKVMELTGKLSLLETGFAKKLEMRRLL